MIVPVCSLILAVFLAHAVIGPFGRLIGDGVAFAVRHLLTGSFAPIGAALFGFLYAPLVITGVHQTTLAIDMQMIQSMGGTPVWPLIALSNIARASAVVGIIIASRKQNEREISVPAAISAYLGVTEPAMYGINLKYRFPMLCAMIGSGLAGLLCGLNGVLANGIGVGGLPGILPSSLPTGRCTPWRWLSRWWCRLSSPAWCISASTVRAPCRLSSFGAPLAPLVAAGKYYESSPHWWQNGVIYQIYPKSFQDTTGSGTGDLRGVTARLDYLQKLGVDAIWLTPFYVSPQVDNGYDVANYTAIDPSYGTMADFDALVAEAKARGIRIVLDMVLNHTSTEHEWFRQSLNKESPYRQFYIWRDGEPDALPNNWRSKFGGNAWQWHADSGQYYLHLFAIEQADLNWENPAVRAELKRSANSGLTAASTVCASTWST